MSSDPDAAPTDSVVERQRANLFSRLRLVSGLTLVSRVLGMVRDVGMATLFGNGVIFDAFSVAFRIPNLARRLFGEGALTTAFLPAFVQEIERGGKPAAWRLATAVLMSASVALTCLVLIAEFVLWSITWFGPWGPETELLISLTAVMLPYLLLICLAAQISAVLHGLGHFTWPALLPVVLNSLWIAAIWLIAPQLESPGHQIHAVAIAIVVAGIVQVVAPLPTLLRLGFRFDFDWRSTRGRVAEIARQMLPVIIGLSITQLNTLCDSLIAWGFAAPVGDSTQRSLLQLEQYPLQAGTASALYLGQRIYQFPLGVFGVALGTVLFPLLAQHAQRNEIERIRDDLTLGLRLVIAIGIPASAGLVLLAEPITKMLFQYGAFSAENAKQTADMVAAYSIGVWAYCGLLIIHRGYYAVGDRVTPVRIGALAVLLNFALNMTLIWFIGGRGLAVSTAGCAMLQFVVVVWLFQRRIGSFDWRAISSTIMKSLLATVGMSAVCLAAIQFIQASSESPNRVVLTFVPLTLSILTYFTIAKIARMDEVWLLLKRPGPSSDE